MARGGRDDGKALAEDAALFGLAIPEPEEDEGLFEVDEDNWQAVMVFCQCSTQWQYGAMGGVTGLNYQGVKVVLELTVKQREHREIFAAIQVMERAAMAVINQRAEQQREQHANRH